MLTKRSFVLTRFNFLSFENAFTYLSAVLYSLGKNEEIPFKNILFSPFLQKQFNGLVGPVSVKAPQKKWLHSANGMILFSSFFRSPQYASV